MRLLFVHKNTRNSPWTRIKVLVRAPGSKIDIPVMQSQPYIPNRMGQVNTDNTALVNS